MTDTVHSDRQLVDTILGGDTGAFRVLVERESGSVIAICRRILGNSTEAEDVAQDVFIRTYRSLATYRGDGPFAAWIARIAARQALARLVARPGPAQLDEQAEAHFADASEVAADPQAWALVAEQRAALRQAVASLPRDQRDVVILRFFRDFSLEEIADATSRPVGTVKSRLHRAMANLRGRLPSRSEQ